MFDLDRKTFKLLKAHKICILLRHSSKPLQRRDTGKEVCLFSQMCWVMARTTGSLMQANSQRIGGSTE